MSEPKNEAEQPPKAPSAATEISYCPRLGIYHYVRRSDNTDYMFDSAQLEATIDAYIKAANPMEAEFMALLTAMARKAPHQVVAFDDTGKCTVIDLEEKSSYAHLVPDDTDPVKG